MSTLELFSPTNLDDALKFIQRDDKEVAIIASGTDLIPRIRKRQVSPSVLLDISSFQNDLRYIRSAGGVLSIGALTTLTDVLESPLVRDRLSVLHEAAELFGAPQVRNVATVGGNICSAASSEDLIPVFMALGANLKLVSAQGERTLPMEGFLKGKRATKMKRSEILAEVSFEIPRGRSWTGFEKLGRRNMLIVSLVSMALSLSVKQDLETVDEVRIAMNRVSERIPAMAVKTQEFLGGRKVTQETIAQAQKVLASEIALTSDFRASGPYRAEIAQVYLKRLLLRCSGRIRGSG